MGFLAMQDEFADTAGGFPTNTFHKQWALDFDVLTGSTIDVHTVYDFLSAGGGLNHRIHVGGTSGGTDGTQILTHNSGGSGQYATDNTGVTRPMGPQIIKLLTNSSCGDGCGGTARAWSLTIGNSGSAASMCLDGGMEAAVLATSTLIHTFGISHNALPGAANLTVTACIYHEADALATINIREGGTYNTVDGTIRGTASMTGSAEAQSVSFTWTRPVAATQLKICVEGSEGVNIHGATLVIQAV